MLSLQDKAEGWAGMAGGKLGSAAGRAGERAVPGQWKDRGELVSKSGHGVQTSTEHLGHVGAEGDEKYVTG